MPYVQVHVSLDLFKTDDLVIELTSRGSLTKENLVALYEMLLDFREIPGYVLLQATNQNDIELLENLKQQFLEKAIDP